MFKAAVLIVLLSLVTLLDARFSFMITNGALSLSSSCLIFVRSDHDSRRQRDFVVEDVGLPVKESRGRWFV